MAHAARRKRMQVMFHSSKASAAAADMTLLLERIALELGHPKFLAEVRGC